MDSNTGAVAGVAVRDVDAGDTTTPAEAPVMAAGPVDHVFVEVLDQAGLPVPDLTAADFSLQANNVALDVVAVRRGTPRPMSIALLVDNGGRIATRAEREALRGGLAAFLRTLPPRHEVSLYTLRGRLRRVVGATTDRGALDDAIGRVRVGARGRVGLLDSVREVSEPRYEDDESFPVIVLVLPNGDADRGGAREEADLHMARLAAAGVMVHAVVLEPRSAVPGIARDLTRLLRGVYMTLTSRTELSLGLARLASRLADGYERMSMQYRVSYVHSGDEDTEIMIGVKRSGVDIRPLLQLQSIQQMLISTKPCSPLTHIVEHVSVPVQAAIGFSATETAAPAMNVATTPLAPGAPLAQRTITLTNLLVNNHRDLTNSRQSSVRWPCENRVLRGFQGTMRSSA